MKAPLVMFEASSRVKVLQKARLRINPKPTKILGRDEVFDWWKNVSPLKEVKLDGALCWVGHWGTDGPWTAYRYEDLLIEALVFWKESQ